MLKPAHPRPVAPARALPGTVDAPERPLMTVTRLRGPRAAGLPGHGAHWPQERRPSRSASAYMPGNAPQHRRVPRRQRRLCRRRAVRPAGSHVPQPGRQVHQAARTSIPAVCPVLDTGKTAPGVDSRPGSRPGCSRVRPWHAAAIVVLDRSRSSLCRAEQGGPGQPTVRNARCAGLRGRQCYAVASADDGAIALTRPASHLIGIVVRPEA